MRNAGAKEVCGRRRKAKRGVVCVRGYCAARVSVSAGVRGGWIACVGAVLESCTSAGESRSESEDCAIGGGGGGG